MTELKHLPKLWKRGTDFLGTEHAILCGAMTWVSERNLVAAISNAGGFGVIASGNMPPDLLDEEIDKTREMTKKPFGVNMITIAPFFKDHMEVAIAKKCEFVIFAGAIPTGKSIERIKETGSKILAFAPTLALGKRMIRQGVDAIIIEGSEAGGHIGPVATSVLAQEVLAELSEVPVFVAGGIGTGEMLANYLLMGAAGCQLGTRFVVAEECIAHPDFKKAFIRAKSRDAQPTVQYDKRLPVIPVRALINEATKDFNALQLELIKEIEAGDLERDDAQMRLEEFWMGALRNAVVDGDIKRGSIMAGQSVGLVKEVMPAKDIIAELVGDAEKRLAEVDDRL